MMKDGLTICLVYHSQSAKDLIKINFDLASGLNPGIRADWIAANNSMGAVDDNMDSDISVIKGADVPQIGGSITKWTRASYHHAAGINLSMPHVKTRFALILDADLFIVRPFWIPDVLNYMRDNGIAFFGAPYHPARYTKYRYFPCAQCLFIDFEKINQKSINFLLDYSDNEKGLFRKIKRKLRKTLTQIFGERLSVGQSKDTGYRIYQQYHNNSSIKWESVKPVFKKQSRLPEYFLPEALCFEPKIQSYYSEAGFKENGVFDARSRGWEEYMWKEKPFALHLKKAKKDLSLIKLREYLNQSTI